uniref:von Willebrand factor A domain-containing protein 5A-like isoform X3 n=1 Tax=Crassostrea virginica TaxID=6565 RepID=A0A8B8DEF9_CRAVI|nr:von Willebrand factor A domain-containing protein 5A-like isoform X3 [Crassostrea virginica]
MDLPKCGLLSKSSEQSVPLKKIDIEVSIKGFIANVRSDLHYINDSDENLETKFLFPLDSDSAVYKFEAEIDGRTIVAEVQEKSQARTTYNDAINSGHTAMYMGEEENTGDLFCIELGNLPAQTAAKLSFSYVQELDMNRDNIGTFMLPTVINPRYMPDCTPSDEQEDEPEGVSEQAQRKTLVSDAGTLYCSDFTIDLTLIVAGNRNLTWYPNSIEVEVLAAVIGKKQIETSVKLNTGSDFTISILYEGFDNPWAHVEEGNKESQSAFLSSDVLMVNFVPKVEIKDKPCEFVFIIDRSGSMDGDRIEKAKETLLLLLKSLPVNCIFNIVSFGSTYSFLFPTSQEYNEENLRKALDLQKTMEADMGGTEIFKPLKGIFKQKPSTSHSRQIFLLTDGMVSNVPSIVDLVRKQKNTRIFTFGIGDGCSTELVRDVAKASNGKPTFVKDNDRLQSKVMSILKSSTCGITDVKLDWNLPKDCSLVNIPEDVPTIFPGEKNILYAMIIGDISKNNNGKKNSLKLSGKAGESTVEFEVEMAFIFKLASDCDVSLPLHRLAAKRKLSEMEICRSDENNMKSLSVDVNIPCRHTAFVGVDKNDKHIIVGLQDEPRVECSFIESAHYLGTVASASLDLKPATCMSRKMKTAPASSLKEKFFVFRSKKNSARSVSSQSRQMAPEDSLDMMAPVQMMDCGLDDLDEDIADDHKESKYDGGNKPSKVVQLVEKQNFDGSWKLDESLCEIISKPLDRIKEAAVVKDMNVWVTAIVIAFLRKEFVQQKAEWNMIEEKALRWLKTKDLEGKDVIQEASGFLLS